MYFSPIFSTLTSGQDVVVRIRREDGAGLRVERSDGIGRLLDQVHAHAETARDLGKTPLAKFVEVFADDLILQGVFLTEPAELNEKAIPQVERADAGRVKALDHFENALQIGHGHAGVGVHFFRRGLEKAVVIDVADHQLGQSLVTGLEFRAVDLADEMLLERFLVGDGIEEKLPPFLVVVTAAVVAGVLRHVFAPLLVELGKLIELLFEIFVLLILFLGGRRLGRFFFEHRIGLQLLLHDVAQFEHRRLQDHEALLQLRGQDLLHRQVLGLLHSGSGHVVKMATTMPEGKNKMQKKRLLERFLLLRGKSPGFNMIRSCFPNRPSRSSLLALLTVATLSISWLLAPAGYTQAPAAATTNAVLNGLLAKLKTQQDQLAANQTKIEAQTAQLKEELREAKIYSGRGGSRR